MAPEHLGKGGPPSSTLAAQLVNDISTSTRSTRPDDTAELTKLMNDIERVKNQPDLLKTKEDRISHNHMLVYVVARIRLENLKWDDPFADREWLCDQVMKGISFLSAVLKETPEAFQYVPCGKHTFILRGQEPLWIWILPKALKLLGHTLYASISEALERFFRDFLEYSLHEGFLWDHGPSVLRYYQTIFMAVLKHIKGLIQSNSRGASRLQLPTKPAIEALMSAPGQFDPRGCFYTIRGIDHCVRHATSLLSVIRGFVAKCPIVSPPSSLGHNTAWVLDSMLALNSVRAASQPLCKRRLISSLQDAIHMAKACANEQAPGAMLTQKPHFVLLAICSEVPGITGPLMVGDEDGAALRHVVCMALLQLAKGALDHRPVLQLITTQLIPPFHKLLAENEAVGSISVLLSDIAHCLRVVEVAAGIVTLQDQQSALGKFEDERLRLAYKDSGLQVALEEVLNETEGSTIANRRKPPSRQSRTLANITLRLCRLVQVKKTDLSLVESGIPSVFPKLSEKAQCEFLDLLADLSCAADGTLTMARMAANSRLRIRCAFCIDQAGATRKLPPICSNEGAKSSVLRMFLAILHLPSFLEAKRPRIIAMMNLRRVVRHSENSELLDLEKSGPGQWCLQSLQSSIRELRITSGRTLAEFVRSFPPGSSSELEELNRRNRANALSILKSISDRDEARYAEACIMAWGQAGRLLQDEELNLVLVKLVEYMGHRNMIISGLAVDEIAHVAAARRTTPKRLFEPFWRTLAFSAVKDLIARPQTTRMIAELLQIKVTDLLILLQKHALPYLILAKKTDVIQKIAEARGDKHSFEMCIDNANFPHILALLLMQDMPEVEEYSMALLRHVSSKFNKGTFLDYLRAEPFWIAHELLKASADSEEGNRTRGRKALYTMASLLLGDAKEKTVKKGDLIGKYLQQHALGLTTRYSEVINNTMGTNPPVQEQKLCLRAMEQMIRLARSYARVARPQVTACLLEAISVDELRSAAFSCWEAMFTHMEDDLEALIETTFFIVGRYWNTFGRATKIRAKTLLNSLFDESSRGILTEFANRLPTLKDIDELADISAKVNGYKTVLDPGTAFGFFARRLHHEYSGIVLQSLGELADYLRENQAYLQKSAISEQPDPVISDLMRALLDCSSKYNGLHGGIAARCAECIGLVGCIDSNRLEAVREQQEFVVVHNFDDAGETTDFALFLLENVLANRFLATTDIQLQGFLAWTIQSLLDTCDFRVACHMQGQGDSAEVYRKWLRLSESAREVLTPFLSSYYHLAPMTLKPVEYPIYQPGKPYRLWLKTLSMSLLSNGQNVFAQLIFDPLLRVIRVKDLSIAEFLLPYLALHVIVGQDHTTDLMDKVVGEFTSILQHQAAETASHADQEEAKRYHEAVFRVLDYFMRWIQLKKTQSAWDDRDKRQIRRVQKAMDSLHPDLLARRALDCKQYARALFFYEPYAYRKLNSGEAEEREAREAVYVPLQEIYSQIDDPDSLEGFAMTMPQIDLNLQIQGYRKAGRWSAVQTWCEIQLAETPDKLDVQLDLLNCLKESGQQDVLLNYVEAMKHTSKTVNRTVPFAVEASWATSKWKTMEKYVGLYNGGDATEIFNLGVAHAMLSLRQGDFEGFKTYIQATREKVAATMSHSATSSLHASHDARLKCHALSDLEMIARQKGNVGTPDQQVVRAALSRRLDMLGAYVSEKQYLLGISRAAMKLASPSFTPADISSLWLSSARLARKASSMHVSFNSIIHAQNLGDPYALIENAKLLWKDGHNRKAVTALEKAMKDPKWPSMKNPEAPTKLMLAKAHLLLAKWTDATGQANVAELRHQYLRVVKMHPLWEKGHYYLGRHYKKILESEVTLKPDDQSDEFLSGETAKLVIENYMRSLNYGSKYLYQTLPRILTLWLDLGSQVDKAPDGKVSLSKELHGRRKKILAEVHQYFLKHLPRMPAFIFYTALPQIVARIAHPNPDVFAILQQIVNKVVEAHPRQALWSLFACMTARQTSDRRARGQTILSQLRNIGSPVDNTSYSLRQLLRMGEKLADQLLLACNNGDFQSNRTTMASITRDLHFNHKCTPCPMVVPIEACLAATLPAATDNVKKHKAFSRDVITIDGFLEDVLVLGSLAKPRKLMARGSDGKTYGLLIKPKDDLRTDQRLMEFNAMINRSLKRDSESSRRQLYIKTYAVTPLNEECGIIEWVDGLKTLRDILLSIYKTRGVSPNYNHIAQLMKEASLSESNLRLFTEDVVGQFPAVLPEWFTSQFPNPSVWLAARLKYIRSCAVMSMVGTILGLGDRHGENVLLEEGNGGIFHVDFNCLFDKGLTFAQPERVPFRLTHNMRAAMGLYEYEGPFRKCSELTLQILRQQEETLMTILEAFIYDPTLDLQRDKKKKHELVKLNPTSVVESIRRKVRGLLPDESIPLGVEGQVEELIRQATDPRHLTAMYIGWCPFL